MRKKNKVAEPLPKYDRNRFTPPSVAFNKNPQSQLFINILKQNSVKSPKAS